MTDADLFGESCVGQTVAFEILGKRHGQEFSHIGQTPSRAFRHSGQDDFGRIGYLRSMAQRNNRIKEYRERSGLTLEQLAAKTRHATKPGGETDLSTIQKLEKGRRKLTREWQQNIAEALGIEPGELLDTLPEPTPIRRVPRIGHITGGNWREAIEDVTDLVPTTKGGPNTFALVVQGDSMNLIVPSDTTIFIDPDDRALVDKKLYAMFRVGGDTTFKRFRSDPPRLEPCSDNLDHKPILMGEDALLTLGRVVGAEIEL